MFNILTANGQRAASTNESLSRSSYNNLACNGLFVTLFDDTDYIVLDTLPYKHKQLLIGAGIALTLQVFAIISLISIMRA